MRTRVSGSVVAFLALLAGCGDEVAAMDGGADAAIGVDAGRDGAAMDAGSDAARLDGGPLDGALPGSAWLVDVAEASGIDFVRVAADGYASVPDRLSGGVCAFDADGVPPLDLFFAMRPSTSGASRLYVARGPWAYADETDARGLTGVGDAMGCLAFDADEDGDDDLLVTGLGAVRLFLNEAGVFSDETARLGLALDARDLYASAAAGDVDGDGDTDIVVAGMVRYDPAKVGTDCGVVPCSAELVEHAPIPNLLLVRQPSGAYVELAAVRAPDLARAEPTLVVAIADIDGDATPDVYVGNDIGGTYRDRVLVRDAGGILRDRGDELGLAYNRRGYGIDTMGFSSADIDGDGRPDYAVTSWEADATAIFLCDGARCEDRATSVGTDAFASAFRWGAALVDLDLDGDPELIEATGHYYDDDETAAMGHGGPRAQIPTLAENVGGLLVPYTLEVDPRATRGIAVADLDDDGRPDVVLAPSEGRPLVLRNVHAPRGRALRVALAGNADGARVTVRWPGGAIVRDCLAGEGYLGSFDPRVLFGVPYDGPVDVEVRWPGGAVTTARGVALGGDVVVRE